MDFRLSKIVGCLLLISTTLILQLYPSWASGQTPFIDCPGDTAIYAGGMIELCPLSFLNSGSTEGYLSYFLKDTQGWASYPFAAGYTRTALSPGEGHDICLFWDNLSIGPPAGAEEGSWTDVKVVVRSIDHPGPWPVLTITENSSGSWQFEGRETPVVEIDIPSGTALDFSWAASPGSHGAGIEGYRHGFDLTDLFDPSEWNTVFGPDYQSYSTTLYAGLHMLYVEVVDDSGTFTLGRIQISVVPGSSGGPSPAYQAAPFPDFSGAVFTEDECTFRVTVDNSTQSRLSTWGGIKSIYR